MQDRIPINEKFILSIEEASEYFGIGLNKMRQLLKENRNADFVLWKGNRAMVKRTVFEKMILRINNI